MGIKGLMKLLTEEAAGCIKESELKNFTGRTVAIDASMALYQFLIAVRSDNSGPSQLLTNSEGEVTSHLQGIFNRTIRLMENGLKPVYVFDGKPPTMKSGELAKRHERREQAKENLATATEAGNAEDIDKFTRRLVKVTPQHGNDCKELLNLMGVPAVTAPCEAESTCAELAKKGKVFAVGTEDMDALTFGSPVLLRRLTFAAARKLPILEVNLAKALDLLELTHDEFIDVCILCGCDYCDSIRGIGYKKAYKGIKEHKSIEGFLKHLQESKPKGIVIPENWLGDDPIYVQARQMFKEAEVIESNDLTLQWTEPKETELKEFLVDKHGFNIDRVLAGIEKLKKSKGKHSQRRLDSFFKVLPSKSTGAKRKPETKSKKSTTATKRGKPRK